MTVKSVPADSEIKERYLTDRKEGFRLLYQKYSSRIFAVCRRYSADNEEALDYFQEAMLRINHKISSYRHKGEGSLLAWMKRLTVNMILDSIRKSDKTESIEYQKGLEDYSDVPYEDAVQISAEQMQRMIASLSPVKRAVFNLFCIEGYSHKEIGEALGLSEKGSSSILSRARKELVVMIKEYLKRNI